MKLLKILWKEIALILIFLFIISGMGIRQCKERRQEVLANEANTAILRALLVDSVRTTTMQAESLKLDSVKSVEREKRKAAQANADYWERIAQRRRISAEKYKSKADSIAQVYQDSGGVECIEIIAAFRQANDTLRLENKAFVNANLFLNREIEKVDNQLKIAEKQLAINDTILISKINLIATYQDHIGNLQCYRDWGIKHPFWRWAFRWKCK